MAETDADRAEARARFLDLTRAQVETGLKELGLPRLSALVQSSTIVQDRGRTCDWRLHIACMVTVVLIILLSAIVYRVAVADPDQYRQQKQSPIAEIRSGINLKNISMQ